MVLVLVPLLVWPDRLIGAATSAAGRIPLLRQLAVASLGEDMVAELRGLGQDRLAL